MFLFLAVAPLAHAAPDDPAAFQRFIEASERAGSTAVYVEQDGHALVDWHRGPERPALLMSATKSIAALTVGLLVDAGRIASWDEPLTDWYPEVAGTPLATVTVRQLLSQTSGLDPCADLRTCPGSGDDALAFALHSKMTTAPGTWDYNNNAVNLLSGIVQRVTGASMSSFADSALFRPLGITDPSWDHDANGVNFASAGLSMTAHDLAKIGELMLAHGRWKDTQILSAATIDTLTRPQAEWPWYGMLWWTVTSPRAGVSQALFDYWRERGTSPETLLALQPLVGRSWTDGNKLYEAERDALGGGQLGFDRYRAFAARTWPYDAEGGGGFAAEGQYGQYLVVLPAAHVVAVRQRYIGLVYQEHTNADGDDDDKRDLDQWPEQLAAHFSASNQE